MNTEETSAASEQKKGRFWSRLLDFTIVRILLARVMVIAVAAIVQTAFQLLARNLAVKHFLSVTYLPAVVAVAAVLLTYRGFVHWIEKRPVTELSGRGAVPELTLGVVLGGTMFAATVGLLALLGFFHVLGMNAWWALVPAAVGAAVSAVIEEILFRGIIFRLTERSLGTWLAIAISALLFGAVHLPFNKNANLQAGLAIMLEAGIFLAAAFVTTRRLWFVMGAHFGWNFVEGGVFGAVISGHMAGGLLKSQAAGPTYLSGGPFGVESSIVAIAVCLAVALLLLRYAKLKGRFIAPYWQREQVIRQ
jgi:membrane protease YdiL (CAAX protease family)